MALFLLMMYTAFTISLGPAIACTAYPSLAFHSSFFVENMVVGLCRDCWMYFIGVMGQVMPFEVNIGHGL
jgi:hypothetical protein